MPRSYSRIEEPLSNDFETSKPWFFSKKLLKSPPIATQRDLYSRIQTWVRWKKGPSYSKPLNGYFLRIFSNESETTKPGFFLRNFWEMTFSKIFPKHGFFENPSTLGPLNGDFSKIISNESKITKRIQNQELNHGREEGPLSRIYKEMLLNLDSWKKIPSSTRSLNEGFTKKKILTSARPLSLDFFKTWFFF